MVLGNLSNFLGTLPAFWQVQRKAGQFKWFQPKYFYIVKTLLDQSVSREINYEGVDYERQ